MELFNNMIFPAEKPRVKPNLPFDIKIGADPELFLKKGRSYVCADGIIPGTKLKPHPVECGAVQVDGMAVEFNINPASSEDEFVNNISKVMEQLDKMVGDHKLVCKPSVKFNDKVWKNAPDEAKVLGCEPDFNAYTGKPNPKPDAGANFRTAAGHIHIGWTEGANPNDPNHVKECEAVVKALDVMLGIPSLLIDGDAQRRKLYGAAGAYRPKPYGVEYRVLSNFWLLKPKYARWVYRTVVETLSSLYKDKKLGGQVFSAESTINTNAVVRAKRIIGLRPKLFKHYINM